ncbi:MAG: hypothetical protein IT236_12955 [Bacteroidia bacterium]|nr:hypothetical protein [Bacteroidia bacterium]
METGFEKRFLVNRDDTGRFIVESYRTGKKYFVEVIEDERTPQWGDVNPVTKKVEGNYGGKYRGGISEKESLLTPENGFTKVHYSGVGASPFSVIDELDAKLPTLEK